MHRDHPNLLLLPHFLRYVYCYYDHDHGVNANFTDFIIYHYLEKCTYQNKRAITQKLVDNACNQSIVQSNHPSIHPPNAHLTMSPAAAAAAAAHSHRAGKLKQQNKKNKRSNASKRAQNRRAGGKIQSLPSRSNPKRPGNSSGDAKANRANAAKQRRDASRKAMLDARRGLPRTSADAAASTAGARGGATPPRMVGILSLSEEGGELEELVRGALAAGADALVSRDGGSACRGSSSVTAAYRAHQKGGIPHLTFLANASSFRPQYRSQCAAEDASVGSALDLCRICDVVLLLIDGSSVTGSEAIAGATMGMGMGSSQSIAATSVKTSAGTAHLDHLISDRGERILTAIKAQGLPTPVTVIVHKEIGTGVGVGTTGSGRGAGSVLGNVIGGNDNDNEGMMEEVARDDDGDDGTDEEEGMDCATSTGMATQRSSKSIRRTHARRRAELKRFVSRFAVTEFGENSKVAEIDIVGASGITNAVETKEAGMVDATASGTVATATTESSLSGKSSQTSLAALIRMLCTLSASGPHWVADVPRPYLVTDGTASTTGAASPPSVEYDANAQQLKLTGYIRGNTPWNVNHLVHVPHLGTFAAKNVVLAGVDDGGVLLPPIVAAGRKSRVEKKSTSGGDNAGMEGGTTDYDNANDENYKDVIVLAESDPEHRESLEMFASPDSLEGEQNLIGFDEEDGHDFDDDDDDDGQGQRHADGGKDAFRAGTARPAGWSDYQSAWLDALGDNMDPDNEDHGELAFALNKKKSGGGDATATVGGDEILVDDEDMEANHPGGKRALLAQRKKDREDDLEFPDEVAVEEEGSARDRYARYRSLKSFRKSHWDPKENLPETYGAAYHFASFKATQKDVIVDMKDMKEFVMKRALAAGGISGGKGKDGDVEMDDDESLDEEDEALIRACVPCGAYVTITLEGVSPAAYSRLSPDSIVSAVALLPHENKVSVLHMGLSQTSKCDRDDEVPTKSKDVLTFRCGWRTWKGRPIFSQNNINSDKHKFERFMPTDGAFFATTVFGPVTYSPCPVLMFRESENHDEDGKRRELLAHGSMIGADADRIVLKRIILTGYPTRVHKRHATVKYMFYNPEDVKVCLKIDSCVLRFFISSFSYVNSRDIFLVIETVVPTCRIDNQAWTPRKYNRECW
ncbi:hypothetical protein ACHAXS_010254 [Conticribra weissflogii]